MTADEAIKLMRGIPRDSLIETIYYAHKDQYGIKGHHLMQASQEQLVDWWINHYEFDENSQSWHSKIPFDSDG